MNFVKKYFKFDVKYVVHSGAWLMFGYVFTVAGVLGTSYVFANYLSPSVYGQYKYLLSIGAILSTLSLTGLAPAITQGVAKRIPGFFNYATRLGLKYGLIVSCLSLAGAVYYYISGDHGLAFGLVTIALLQPFFNNSNLIFSYLQGKEAFRTSTQAHIAKMLVTSLAIIFAALLFEDPVVLLVTFLFSHTCVNLLVRYVTKPEEEKCQKNTESQLLIRYAKHTSVRNIFTGIAGQVDKILIFQNLSAVDLAVYSFAIALPEQFKSITKSINTILLPRFARHHSGSIKSNMAYKASIYAIFLSLLVGVYIAIAPYIYGFLFPAYHESILLSQVFSIGTIFTISGLPVAALQAKTHNGLLYKLEISGTLFQIFTMVGLFSLYGIMGVVIGRLLGRFFNCVVAFYLFYTAEY